MKYLLIVILLFGSNIDPYAQTTFQKDGTEYFNGDDRHLMVYLNNNYHQLDPIEGVWMFTRIEFDDWGREVSRTANEITAAIVRDPGNLRRAFVEVNISRAFCGEYQVTYSIQTGGGSGYYPCEPVGCGVISGQYFYDVQTRTLSRPAFAFLGTSAVLVGIKTFPQGPPTEMLPYPGGTIRADAGAQVSNRKPRIISHESGWEPYIDWGKQIFPAYILSMGTIDPKTFPVTDDYLGDPLSVIGILIKNPKSASKVDLEILPTKYTDGVKESYVLEKKGKQYAIFPKVPWNYDLLRCQYQATPLDFTFKVSINGKPVVIQTVTANLRSIDDCPLFSYDYNGEEIDLKFMAAAFINEGSPIVKQLTKEIREKGIVRDFVGLQLGSEEAILQVYAFWRLLRDKGISYSSITNNGQQTNPETYSQRIRLIEDIMDETQANCVDGTALFASCLGAVDITPILVFVPGHAFLGYIVGYSQEDNSPIVLYLETTMLGGKNDIPDEYRADMKEEPFKSIRQVLYKRFHAGKKTPNPELDYFVYATMMGFVTIDQHLNEHPHDVMQVNLDDARALIKPIYRCNTDRTTPAPIAVTNSGNPNPSANTPTAARKPANTGTGDRQSISSVSSTSGARVKRKGTQTYDSYEFMTEAPDHARESYKVQLEITANYNPGKPEYGKLAEFGRIYVEYIIETGRTRVMLGDFDTLANAQKAAKKAQSLNFSNVAVVKYQNGNRYESIYRDWKSIPN